MPYPSRLLIAIPVLPVLSIEETLAFFESKLGFGRHIDSSDYAGVERDGIQIHFRLSPDATESLSSGCRINVAGVDELYERSVREGIVHPEGALEEKPWGFREFTIVDPSGNEVVFAEEIEGWVEE